jgi:hypothetical protein
MAVEMVDYWVSSTAVCLVVGMAEMMAALKVVRMVDWSVDWSVVRLDM